MCKISIKQILIDTSKLWIAPTSMYVSVLYIYSIYIQKQLNEIDNPNKCMFISKQTEDMPATLLHVKTFYHQNELRSLYM